MKAREAIEDALREINVVAVDEAMDAEHIQFGLRKLRRMLLSWQSLDYNVWLKAEQSVTLAAATGIYTLDPVRPLRILGARLSSHGIETPMEALTREDYDRLPDKASAGRPTSYYYDRQREEARLYVWPVPSAAGETIRITYARQIDPAEKLTDDVDVPDEWGDAVVYGLAVALAPAYQRPAPVDIAAGYLNAALAFDREDSVFFT